MNVSDDRDDLSSVRADWIPQTIGSRKVPVAMLTLNDLISEYGVPVFIKIDVEGFEKPVLDGLSVFPGLLSFEFNTIDLTSTFRCLDMDLLKGALFNYALGDPHRFELSCWVEAAFLKKSLSEMSGYGDVFAKVSN